MIKICGLRSPADVAAAVAAGADAIGFVFAQSVRRVSAGTAQRAARAAPAGVLRVAVMKHPSNAEWQHVLEAFGPDVLQTDAGDFDQLEVPGTVRRWPVYREGSSLGPGPGEEEFLYEGPVSGSGATVDWQQAASVARLGRMILAGGLSPENVGRAVSAARPWGVDVSSGVERTPGNKDPHRIESFIKAARAAEQQL